MRKDNENYIVNIELSPIERGGFLTVGDCLKMTICARYGEIVDKKDVDIVVAEYVQKKHIETKNDFDEAVQKVNGALSKEYFNKGINLGTLNMNMDEERKIEVRKVRTLVKNMFSGLNHEYETQPILDMAKSFGIERIDEKFAIETFNYLNQNLPDMSLETMTSLFHRGLSLEFDVSGCTSIKFPDIKKGYGEFLVGLYKNNLEIIVVACPDYRENYSLGNGLGVEANLYLDNIPKFLEKVSSQSIDLSGSIVIANTEDDLRDVLKRLTNNDKDEFLKRCRVSAQKLASDDRMEGLEDILFVGLLTDLIPDFRKRQYQEENDLVRLTYKNPKFGKEVKRISKQRAAKYRNILGRNEQGNELTIRYMAQYKALSRFLEEKSQLTEKTYMIFNYSTPNLEFLRDKDTQHNCVFEVQSM